MTPYERLDCADDSQFSGLEPEREAGVRWVHWRIWWRPEQEESGQAVDPLALLGEEELRALLRATGWGDEASAGAGRGEIVALLRGCMRTQAESAKQEESARAAENATKDAGEASAKEGGAGAAAETVGGSKTSRFCLRAAAVVVADRAGVFVQASCSRLRWKIWSRLPSTKLRKWCAGRTTR